MVFVGVRQHIMSTNSEQPEQNIASKPAPKRRRKKNREFSNVIQDFLERTGLNEDLEAAVAHVTRHGINNFWKNFQPVDVANNLPPGNFAPPPSPVDDPNDPYVILGVHRNTPPEIIRAVYMAWVKNHHPDVGGDPETFKKINVAYDEIKKVKGL